MAQSPELAGGAGFTFADAVAGYYLVALLANGYAAGVPKRTVCKVSVEQRDFDQPLDDIVVDFEDEHGNEATLSLQVKSDIKVSSARTNSDFRETIRDSWRTFKQPSFRRGVDRFGMAVGRIAKDKARCLNQLCDFARESVDTAHFEQRFAHTGNASADVIEVRDTIDSLLAEQIGAPCTPEQLHQFLAHFVLVQFDFTQDGSKDEPAVLNNLRNVLKTGGSAAAPELWDRLRQLSRKSAGASGQYDRPRLIRAIGGAYSFAPSQLWAADLAKLETLARLWLSDIENDVGGAHLERLLLQQQLDEAVKEHRVVQIQGLPGTGKSVLLRKRAEADLKHGPILFLKFDQLEGHSWNAFTVAHGLSAKPCADLLRELGAVGPPTLYIDGIDRIESAHQPIIREIVRTIFETEDLADWRIVYSLRDTGIEPLRNWLGRLSMAGIGRVNVKALSDDEAELLASEKPALRSLLFGPEAVREIVRRPFFAKVLEQNFTPAGDEKFAPQSEADLVHNWWRRGGYNAAAQDVIIRQRALISIAAARAKQLNKPISLSKLPAEAVAEVHGLVGDGIVQWVREGHTLRFAHDIYFEWSFLHVLIDAGEAWPDALREAGEPPAIARVVELFSQSECAQPETWRQVLNLLSSVDLRSQWLRAWLIGPLSAPTFWEFSARFTEVLAADDYALFRKLLVWFQAEKTTPSQAILNAPELPIEVTPSERLRYADMLAWPSDMSSWARLIALVLRELPTLPDSLYSDVVAVFGVWQNALSQIPNDVSQDILEQCAHWLGEIDTHFDATKPEEANPRWHMFDGNLGSFRKSVLRLIFHAATAYPAHAEAYMRRVLDSERRRDRRPAEIISFATTLASTHPALLAEVTLKHLRDELPAERRARSARERKRSIEMQARARAIPKAERTRSQQIAAAGLSTMIGSRSVDDHDWRELSIETDYKLYNPTSPSLEPFQSLFEHAPEHALRLVRELSNHAVTAWRQLHEYDHSTGTPIPLDIAFPWGEQRFWGSRREYLWCRGEWVPQALASAYWALQNWAFSQLDAGQPADDLVREIVKGHDSIAALGVASAIALKSETVSEATLALTSSQRLLSCDHDRMRHDFSRGTYGQPGASERRNRAELSHLIPRFVFSADSALRQRAKDAVLAFKDDPPFEYEEHRGSAEAQAALSEEAAEYAELVKQKNYKAYRTEEEGKVAIVHSNPLANTEASQARIAESERYLNTVGIHFWASKSLEAGKAENSMPLEQAIRFARETDSEDLFSTKPRNNDNGVRSGAVAGAASVAVAFPSGVAKQDLVWAREAVIRAATAPEIIDELWYSGSIVTWHHGIFAAHALAALIRQDMEAEEHTRLLLGLVAHPKEVVSLAAIRAAFSLWDINPSIGWQALSLGFRLTHLPPRDEGGPRRGSPHSPKALDAAVSEANEALDTGSWPSLPLPPPPWLAERSPEGSRRSCIEIDGNYWSEPETLWHTHLAGKILAEVPLSDVFDSDAGPHLLEFLAAALDWTIQKIAPPWRAATDDRHTSRHDHYEWIGALSSRLGMASGHIAVTDAKTRFLDPICALDDEHCFEFLSGFVDLYICNHVLDEQTIHEHAVEILEIALDRFLKAPTFKVASYRSGELSGFHEPRLARALMFVSVDHASKAARFANGDWSDIDQILPVVDRFVRAAGWSAFIMENYLTLVERAADAYPPQVFADQVLHVLEEYGAQLHGWRDTFLDARIAGLVQTFAATHTPLTQHLAQSLLRILDHLVDRGDRRSAALQLSEYFREVRVNPKGA
ncbi:ATP-binding protein [Glycocaulis sp.]